MEFIPLYFCSCKLRDCAVDIQIVIGGNEDM